MPGTQLSPKEIAYIKQWRYDEGDGLAPSTIAIRLDRDKSTITRHLAMKSKGVWKKGEEKGRRGPARVLTKAKVATLLPKLEALVGKAKGEYEITSAMLKKSARVKVSARVMMKRLNEQEGTKWYRMRQKPTLTVVDVKDRFAFGKAYGGKNKRWWLKKVQLTIDVKFFPVFLNSKARSHVAQSGTRGVYRRKGQALTEGYKDIRTPKHGLISDAQQTWRHTLDHFKTFETTKWYCKDMESRLDYWTPFLEGIYEAHGTQSEQWLERGKALDQIRKQMRMEHRLSRQAAQQNKPMMEITPMKEGGQSDVSEA
jgi:hypothetical protein